MLDGQSTSGFTLYELMVVLAISAIILAVGVPSFRGTLDNQRMTSATNELVMSLNLAKSEAIKRVVYVTVCKSNDGQSCAGAGASWDDGWIVFANATAADLNSVDAGDEIIRISPSLLDSITVSSIGSVDGFLSFRPSGTIGTAVANLAGTIIVCDERGADFARGVLIDPSGQWQVSREMAHDGSLFTCAG